MKTTVEPLDGNKVKLSVEVEESEFETALDQTFKQIAREVNIPGFRRGKVPRKVLEARIGKGYAREEALRQALPDYYVQAISDEAVDAIAQPDIDITGGQEEGSIEFDAVVEIRPTIEIVGYEDLKVEIPQPVPDDEEIEELVDKLREQHADLETVSRPAQDGDHVKVDIHGSQNGEELEGLTADDYLFEIGRKAVVPELDQNLLGAKPGDILEFDADHPEEGEGGLHFRVLVKDVQGKVLPDLTDDFVEEVSEFDTVDAFRESVRNRHWMASANQAKAALMDNTATALADLVDDDDVPEAMIEGEMETRLQDMAMRLGAQGVTLEQYMEMTGSDSEQMKEELRETAAPAAKADLALRAIADAREIEVTEDDLSTEIQGVADQIGQELDQVRAELESGGRLLAVRSDIRKRQALEWLSEQVEIVDNDGNAVDRADLEVPDEVIQAVAGDTAGNDSADNDSAGEDKEDEA